MHVIGDAAVVEVKGPKTNQRCYDGVLQHPQSGAEPT